MYNSLPDRGLDPATKFALLGGLISSLFPVKISDCRMRVWRGTGTALCSPGPPWFQEALHELAGCLALHAQPVRSLLQHLCSLLQLPEQDPLLKAQQYSLPDASLAAHLLLFFPLPFDQRPWPFNLPPLPLPLRSHLFPFPFPLGSPVADEPAPASPIRIGVQKR